MPDDVKNPVIEFISQGLGKLPAAAQWRTLVTEPVAVGLLPRSPRESRTARGPPSPAGRTGRGVCAVVRSAQQPSELKFQNAALVFGPAIPSGVRPRKRCSALIVLGPTFPSTVPAL